jgi:hypothetical protein
MLKAKLIMDMMRGGGGGQMQMQASMQGGGFPQQQFQQQQQFQSNPRAQFPQQGMRGTGMAPWGGGAGAMVAAGGSLRRQANAGNFGNVGNVGNYGNSSADIVWRRQSQSEELKAMLMQRLQGGAGGGDMSAVMAQLSRGGEGVGWADSETAMQQMLMMKMMRGLSDGGDDIRSQLIKGLMKSAVSGEKFDMTKVITSFERHFKNNLRPF